MRSPILFAALFWILGSSADSLAEEKVPPSADGVQAAFDKFVQAASRTSNWSAELEARQALVSLGPIIIPKLTEAAREHREWRVRRSCYDLLTRSFADDERTADTLLRHGLLDQDPGIRYRSAFYLAQVAQVVADFTRKRRRNDRISRVSRSGISVKSM
jgi:hypothetical protein